MRKTQILVLAALAVVFFACISTEPVGAVRVSGDRLQQLASSFDDEFEVRSGQRRNIGCLFCLVSRVEIESVIGVDWRGKQNAKFQKERSDLKADTVHLQVSTTLPSLFHDRRLPEKY